MRHSRSKKRLYTASDANASTSLAFGQFFHRVLHVYVEYTQSYWTEPTKFTSLQLMYHRQLWASSSGPTSTGSSHLGLTLRWHWLLSGPDLWRQVSKMAPSFTCNLNKKCDVFCQFTSIYPKERLSKWTNWIYCSDCRVNQVQSIIKRIWTKPI